MTNQIINSPFNFHLLSSNFKIWRYCKLTKNDSLILIKELDLHTASCAGSADSTAVRAFQHAARTVAISVAAHAARDDVFFSAAGHDAINYEKIYSQVNEELQETGKIKGFEILNLRTMEKLWISHYDMKILVDN